MGDVAARLRRAWLVWLSRQKGPPGADGLTAFRLHEWLKEAAPKRPLFSCAAKDLPLGNRQNRPRRLGRQTFSLRAAAA
jgi:hypothetical protein